MGAHGLHSSNPSPDSPHATCMAPGRAIQWEPLLPESLPSPPRKKARVSGAASTTTATVTGPWTFCAVDLPRPQPPFRACDLSSPQPLFRRAARPQLPFHARGLSRPQPLHRRPAAIAYHTREQQPLTTRANHLFPPPIGPSRGRASPLSSRPGVASPAWLQKLTRRERRLYRLPKPKMNMMEGASGVAAGGVVTECRGNLLQQCDGCTKRLEEAVTEKNKGSANCRLSLEDCKREAAERPRDPVADMTGAQQLRIVAHEVGHSWY